MGNGKVFKIPDDIIPKEPINDIIVSTNSITDTMREETNKIIRNVMTGIEGNFNIEGSDKR